MKKTTKFLFAMVFSLMAFSANASLINFTSTGTLESGFDGHGYFGTPGTSLIGKQFTLSISIDTDSLPKYTTISNKYYGEDYVGVGTAKVAATVGGVTFNVNTPIESFTHAGLSFCHDTAYCGYDLFTFFSRRLDESPRVYVENTVWGNLDNNDTVLTGSVENYYHVDLSTTAIRQIAFQTTDFNGNGTYFSSQKLTSFDINFPPVTDPDPAELPEPSSIMLMGLAAALLVRQITS